MYIDSSIGGVMVSVIASSVVDRGFDRLECGRSWVRASIGSNQRRCN